MSIPLQILISPHSRKINSIEKTLNPLLKKSQSLKTSPPPPMSHLENCSALTSGNSLHPSTENIATLLKHFKQLRKNLSPLDTISTTQKKCYPPVEYPPPPRKKISTHPKYFNLSRFFLFILSPYSF